MLIDTEVAGDTVKFHFDADYYIKYDVDISNVPKHLINFMIGIILSVNFTWWPHPIQFDELTEEELKCINWHIQINHISDILDGLKSLTAIPIQVVADNIVEDTFKGDSEKVLCSMGMGRDSFTVTNMAYELGFDMRCFIVGKQYREGLWEERIANVKKFYDLKKIPSNIIMLSHMKSWYPWWVFGLPLAYHYNSGAILAGLEIMFSKTRNKSIFSPLASIFSLDSLTEATGINFSSPVMSLSQYAVQKLLVERYPETLPYQRSCMFGDPWCNNCGKCTKTSLWLTALNYNVNNIKLNSLGKQGKPFKTFLEKNEKNINSFLDAKRWKLPCIATALNVDKKLHGEPYDKWIEQANQYVLDLTWNKKAIKKILEQHFEITPYDNIQDPNGYIIYPSKWEEWISDKSVFTESLKFKINPLDDVAYMNRFWRTHPPKPVDERVRTMVKLCKGKVLDVGCGCGQYMPLLGEECVGIDYSIEGLKIVKSLKILSNVEYLPFRDNYFDTVFASEVLEHVKDDVKAVEEMKRVLKDDGLLIASTPNSIVRREYWSQWPPSESDKREYTPKSFNKVLGGKVRFHNYRRGDGEKEVWLVASIKVNKTVD